MNHKSTIRLQSVKLIGRYLRIMSDTDLIPVPECNTIISHLKHLAEKGELMPAITPKLLTILEVCELLNIGVSNFKNLEKDGVFPFKRRKIGGAVRYRNTDIIRFIMSEDTIKDNDGDFVT